MINTAEFIKRLQKILDYYSLSASSFADKVGVQRSSISHILSGRNKPSLDFVTRILTSFPEVDLYWLLNGKGTFPSSIKKTKTSSENIKTIIPDAITKSTDQEIDSIVIFYKDGSFKNYKN